MDVSQDRRVRTERGPLRTRPYGSLASLEGHTVVVAPSDGSDELKSRADLVCSGVDDQDVINAAFDLLWTRTPTGGSVKLLGGTYTVTAPILAAGQSTLCGESDGGTYISIDNSGGGIGALDAAIEVNGMGDFTLTDLAFFGDTCRYLLVSQSSYGHLERLKFWGGGPAIEINNCDTIWMRHCHTEADSVAGLYLAQSARCRIVDNYFDCYGIAPGAPGVKVEDTHATPLISRGHNVIAVNTFDNVKAAHALLLTGTGTWREMVRDNIFVAEQSATANNTFDFIRLENGVYRCVVDGNVMSALSTAANKMRSGINVAAGCTDNVVTDNDTRGAALASVVDAGTGTTLSGNL